MNKPSCYIGIIFTWMSLFLTISSSATDFADNTFLIANISENDLSNNSLWSFVEANDWVGIELEIDSTGNYAYLQNSTVEMTAVLDQIRSIIDKEESKIVPIFIHFDGNIHFLDSVINASSISDRIFYLPQGETWPSINYLVQANRRIIFFVEGYTTNESRILHPVKNYALEISASQITPNSVILSSESNINKELFKINDFQNLPTGVVSNRLGKNQVPDYVNFLLDSWTKYGKKPNFISVGNAIISFDFLVSQLNSFNDIKGQVRTVGKNLERVYWKNPEVLISGGKFSFPIRGGEEVILSPFAPGYSMTPAQLIVTAEMALPEEYSVLASPLGLNQGLTANFNFDGNLTDNVNPEQKYTGTNYSFSQDIDRGTVLKLPENAQVFIGNPELYKLPNSSFTVSCFVKFTDILEFGDNAILGNNEQGYRRGMHLVLRSGHPYFGLWSNDFMSEEVLKNNTWFHLTWRYIIETGQQAIFLNGKYVGGSDGHPPYSGTSDLHIGSALSNGASMRGYIDNLNIWNRPLGNEEISRLALDEEILALPEKDKKQRNFIQPLYIGFSLLILLVFVLLFWVMIIRRKTKNHYQGFEVQKPSFENHIRLFGDFQVMNNKGEDISSLFTPKVKELFIYILIGSVRNKMGVPISDVDSCLWAGIQDRKIANNRAVTLNKLRKILVQLNAVEINSNNGFLQLKVSGNLSCDYLEAFKLCTIPEGMTRKQLDTFYLLVKDGSLLKGIDWPWLDDIRGFIGNQVMDHLLKLGTYLQKENRINEVEKVAQRMLDYDELSEEAVSLQIWAHQQANNLYLAKFQFESFCTRYKKSMGENYGMNFNEFIEEHAIKKN
ncbi:MAG: LamG-like jellyroll fold domain-containing protein [Draconibacterium sp.]